MKLIKYLFSLTRNNTLRGGGGGRNILLIKKSQSQKIRKLHFVFVICFIVSSFLSHVSCRAFINLVAKYNYTHAHTILRRTSVSASVFVVVHCFFPLLPSREPRDRSSSVVDWRRFSRSLTAIKYTRAESSFERKRRAIRNSITRRGAARSTRCSPVLSKKVGRGATDGLSKWKKRRRESRRLLRRRAAVLGEREGASRTGEYYLPA